MTAVSVDRYLILLNVRSAHNVGSMLRTADAIGVGMVYLVGHTPLPIDRFGRPQPDIKKTALGAEQSVAWEHISDINLLLTQLKADGVCIVALEQSTSAIDYKNYAPDRPTALVVGSEVGGLPADLLARVDAVIEIPMRGAKDSLNVSVAAGIALFRLFDR